MKEINNNIEEPVCSFEVSQLLKEKGFDVSTYQFYRNSELIDWTEFSDLFLYKNSDFAENTFIAAPTHSIALEWIRVNFGIIIESHAMGEEVFYYTAYINGSKKIKEHFDTPQEAIEAGLLYTLTKLIP